MPPKRSKPAGPSVKTPQAMKDLLAKLSKNGKLREKLRGAIDVDRVAAIAKEAGIEISSQQISEFVSSRVVVLSDEDLDQMAGQSKARQPARGCWTTCGNNSRKLC